MSGDSVSHNPRVRLATHPEDLPWDSMGKECAWPPLTKRHEIRVLKNIQWGIETYFCGEQYEISGEIFCEMEVLDLDDLGDSYYTALSYTWGDPFPEDYRCWDEQEDSESRENGGINDDENEPSRDYYIHCNGGSIRVTKNLHAALRSGHIHRLEGPLWVDAVSINQDDVAERSLQVGMMDKIYIQAESVLVWLGPKDESSEITIKLAQTISKSYQKMEKEDRPRGHFPFNDPTLYAILGVKPITIKEWDSVIRFFSRTWFRRIWMVQEVALAHRLHFVCGEDDLGWSTLAGFADWIHTFGWDAELKHQMMRNKLGGDILGTELLNLVLDVGKSIDEGVDGEQTRKLLRSFFGVDNVEENGVVFMGLLAYRSQHRTATNPRDKIYGLLGLFQKFRGDRTWECPAVDYSKSVEQVFQEFGELLLRHSKSLGVLSLVEPSQEGELPKLPSWIPDFNKARSTESLIAHECHDACKGWSFVPRKSLRINGAHLSFDQLNR